MELIITSSMIIGLILLVLYFYTMLRKEKKINKEEKIPYKFTTIK
jgi:preprotein translocase subunit YajC